MATTDSSPRPFIADDIVRRAVAGTADATEVRILATAASRLAAKLADVLRNGVSDRDYPVMERAAATAEAINDALFEAQCRRSQAACMADPWGGAGSPSALVQRIAGTLPPVSIAR